VRCAAIIVVAVVAGWATATSAAAQPAPPRVVHAPTGHLLPRDVVHASAGADHRGGLAGAITGSLGGLAQLEIAADDAVLACDPCAGARRATPVWLGSAGLRVGAAPGRWFRHQPALALGVETSFAGRSADGRVRAARVASIHLAASTRLAGLRLHAGASAWDATARIAGGRHRLADGAPPVRPFAAVEWTPGRYPRTTVLADVAWRPELGVRPALRWIGGWGIRYQALAWGSVELAVRHREGDELAGASVLVRVNASLSLGNR
jgi:hypothetical protein